MVTQHCERTKGSRILRFTLLSQPQKTKLNAMKEIHDCGKKIFFPTGQNGPEVSSYSPFPLPKGNKGSVSRSVVSNSLQPHGLEPTRFLCPWDSPGKNTGVGCHSLLQGISLTQGLNLLIAFYICIIQTQNTTNFIFFSFFSKNLRDYQCYSTNYHVLMLKQYIQVTLLP